MNEIPVNTLKAQTHFTEAVFLSDGYIILTPDIPVTTDLINRLGMWGYRVVITEGEVADSSAQAAVADGKPGEIVQSFEDEQKRLRAEEFFKKQVVFLENAFTVFQAREEISVVNFSETVKEMIAELRENRRFMLSIDDSISTAKTYIVTHSVKTAILALAVADYLKFPPFKQIDLGTAALLHVIGMLKIPESIYLSDKQLSPQERKALAAHPVLGFRILKAASFPIAVSQAVLEHNERLDGSGFPRRLVGEKTSQYGKILAVASSYNAAISKRPYKSGIDGHSGIMDLVKDAGKRYDEKALAALVYVLSLYPIGTYIIMSNGSLGMVVKPNPEDPKHPVVKLLVDENGNSYPNPPLVHTREGDEVVISRPLKKEEMDKLKKK